MTNSARAATGNTGRRADGAASMPRDVSRGYTGTDAPTATQYDRGAVRRRAGGTNASQVLPRDSRIDVNGTYARPSSESYGRRSSGSDASGSRGGSYERTRPPSTYNRGGGSSYQPRSGGSTGNTGRSYSAPRGGSSGGGGAARAPSGGGGSRGFSGGGGGGGARGGGYRGR